DHVVSWAARAPLPAPPPHPPGCPAAGGPPPPKLPAKNGPPAIAQLNRRPAIWIKKIVVPNLNQAGRSKSLNHRRGRRWRTDHTVTVEILVETSLAILQCGARP